MARRKRHPFEAQLIAAGEREAAEQVQRHLQAGERAERVKINSLRPGDVVIVPSTGFRRIVTAYPQQTRAGGWLVETKRADGKPWVAGVDSTSIIDHLCNLVSVVRS